MVKIIPKSLNVTYIETVLKKFDTQDCKGVSTPLFKGKLEPNVGKSSYPYQELVGCPMYLAVNTRPDIAYTVSYLSQFNISFGEIHWKAAKRCLQYLKNTKDFLITYKKAELDKPHGYSDADWANSPVDRLSYTGFYFQLGGGPVSWESRKQPIVALSSAEAVYMALPSATKEACFVKRFTYDVTCMPIKVVIYSDSQRTQKLSLNPVHHSPAKHIDVRFHFVREKINDKTVELIYIHMSIYRSFTR